VFTVSNGTYRYTVGSVPGWMPSNSSGSVAVNGGDQHVSIGWSRTSYTVGFTETGLPMGASWSVILNGTTISTTGSTVNFREPNASYSYSVGSASGFGASPANGTVTVNGASVVVSVLFVKVYPVVFTESDLPSGTNWSVTLSGNSNSVVLVRLLGGNSVALTRWSDGASTIRFYASNGSYSYSTAAPGHPNSTGVLAVSGQAAAPVTVTFPSSSSSGFPIFDYAIIGTAVAVVAVAAGLALMRIRGKAPPPATSSPTPSLPLSPPPPS